MVTVSNQSINELLTTRALGGFRTYVPDDDRSRSPSQPALKVLPQVNMIEKKLEQKIRFFLLESNNLAGDYLRYSSAFEAHIARRQI